MTSRSAIAAGGAASVLVHLALIGGVMLLAEVHPFAETPEQQIPVEIVAADEAPPPEPAIKPDNAALDTTPAPEMPQANPIPSAQSAGPASQPAQKPAEPAKTQKAEPQAQPPQQKVAEREPSSPTTPPPQAPQPAVVPPPFPAAIPQEPDLTVKYSVMVGLPPSSSFDAPAETVANVSANATAELRRRLASCAKLPPSVSRNDPVRVVLRVALSQDGRLASKPMLIEASASAKGPALMQSAMSALAACQPYDMLPADKYQEWKVLDLDFTPQNFQPG